MSDVYCFGHVSTDVIIRLKGRFPKPDGYGEIVETRENHSGEATGSALVCTTTPGCVNPPTLEEVRTFLARRGVPLHPAVCG